MSDSPSAARLEMQQARHKTAIAIGVIVGLLALAWTYFLARDPAPTPAQNVPTETR